MSAVAPALGFVVCHVCHGGKKSPFGDRPCLCCKGTGQLTPQEHQIKTTVMFDLAKRVRETSAAQILALGGPGEVSSE